MTSGTRRDERAKNLMDTFRLLKVEGKSPCENRQDCLWESESHRLAFSILASLE